MVKLAKESHRKFNHFDLPETSRWLILLSILSSLLGPWAGAASRKKIEQRHNQNIISIEENRSRWDLLGYSTLVDINDENARYQRKLEEFQKNQENQENQENKQTQYEQKKQAQTNTDNEAGNNIQNRCLNNADELAQLCNGGIELNGGPTADAVTAATQTLSANKSTNKGAVVLGSVTNLAADESRGTADACLRAAKLCQEICTQSQVDVKKLKNASNTEYLLSEIDKIIDYHCEDMNSFGNKARLAQVAITGLAGKALNTAAQSQLTTGVENQPATTSQSTDNEATLDEKSQTKLEKQVYANAHKASVDKQTAEDGLVDKAVAKLAAEEALAEYKKEKALQKKIAAVDPLTKQAIAKQALLKNQEEKSFLDEYGVPIAAGVGGLAIGAGIGALASGGGSKGGGKDKGDTAPPGADGAGNTDTNGAGNTQNGNNGANAATCAGSERDETIAEVSSLRIDCGGSASTSTECNDFNADYCDGAGTTDSGACSGLVTNVGRGSAYCARYKARGTCDGAGTDKFVCQWLKTVLVDATHDACTANASGAGCACLANIDLEACKYKTLTKQQIDDKCAADGSDYLCEYYLAGRNQVLVPLINSGTTGVVNTSTAGSTGASAGNLADSSYPSGVNLSDQTHSIAAHMCATGQLSCDDL